MTAYRWGTAREYVWLYNDSGQSYRNQLLYWLETENPRLHALVLKELARGNRGQHSDPAQKPQE